MSWVAFELDFSSAEEVEMAAALLQLIGFEYFEERPTCLVAYWEGEHDRPSEAEVRAVVAPVQVLAVRQERMEDRNWNEEWERNYPPVEIDLFCRIRAPFHEKDARYAYELEVRPAMAFGTGHHATTASVIRLMKELPLQDRYVLDMGCGTGILGILAEKLGARQVVLADNFDWACASTEENAGRNQCERFEVVLGGPEALQPTHIGFQTIIANINRNVLLEQMADYHRLGTPNADLVLSGFYEEDAPMIDAEAAKYGWQAARFITDKRWMAKHYTRS